MLFTVTIYLVLLVFVCVLWKLLFCASFDRIGIMSLIGWQLQFIDVVILRISNVSKKNVWTFKEKAIWLSLHEGQLFKVLKYKEVPALSK